MDYEVGVNILSLGSDLVAPHKETLSSTQQGVGSDNNNSPMGTLT